jgi:peptidoglycan/LPS O-acetylase OafA/YrhL
MKEHKTKYYPYIDGLRSLAILPVVLYHLLPNWCPGGFAGVDVFFVISGYLITGGIVKDLKNSRFSIRDFYVRRIKRILPAYFAIIGFVLAVFPFVSTYPEYVSICRTAIYSAFYSTNIYFANLISYFDLAAKHNPLLHLWSLGVEEQFYLIIPALILFLWTINKNHLLASLLALFALSFLLSVILVIRGNIQFAFFMLPTRAWELLAGAIVCQLPLLKAKHTLLQPYMAYLGLGLIIIPYIFLNDKTPFPGVAAAPSVLGTSLLLYFGSSGSFNTLLSSMPFVWIGKVSYSLYLWHWPVFVMFASSASWKRGIAGVTVTTIATILSYRFIETPIRQSKRFDARHAFTMLAVGSGIIVGFCLFFPSKQSNNGIFPTYWKGQPMWPLALKDHDSSSVRCSIDDLQSGNKTFLVEIGCKTSSPTFALWGDSHALALMPGLDATALQYEKAGYYINLKHNFTLNTDIGGLPFRPREDRESVLAWLESRPDIVDVFLVNRWMSQIQNQGDINEVLGICMRLKHAGKHVFVFQDVPLANKEALRRLSWGLSVQGDTLSTKTENYKTDARQQNQLIAKLQELNIATIVPVDRAFLNNGVYSTIVDNRNLYFDLDHVNEAGSLRAMKYAGPLIWGHRIKPE